MFELGDLIPLSFQVRNSSGALANATTFTLNITQPDQTIAGPFVITPTTTGVYDYDFVPTIQGRHLARGVATGANACAFTDAFDVAGADPGFIISLADAKAQLRVTTTTNDEELRLYLSAVTGVIQHRCGQILPKTYADIFEVADVIVLRHAPVISLTSVVPTFPADQAYQPIYPTYQLDGPSGICRAVPLYPYDFGWAPWPWNVRTPFGLRLTFTYVAGRSEVPSALQVAARMILEDNWKTRRLAGPMPASEADVPVDRVFIPPEAQTLLETVPRGPRIV